MWSVLNPEEDGPRSKCISVFDVAGIGLGSITGPSWAFLSATTKLLGDHYPERAQNVLIVNAPALFAAVWSLVLPLINEATRAKVRLARSSEVAALFAEFADPDQIPREYGGTFDRAAAEHPYDAAFRAFVYENNKRLGIEPPYTAAAHAASTSASPS